MIAHTDSMMASGVGKASSGAAKDLSSILEMEDDDDDEAGVGDRRGAGGTAGGASQRQISTDRGATSLRPKSTDRTNLISPNTALHSSSNSNINALFSSRLQLRTNMVDTLEAWVAQKLDRPAASLSYERIFSATADGWWGVSFHEKCDGCPSPTIVLCLGSSGCIFGGFTDATWHSRDAAIYSSTMRSFLFQLAPRKELFEQIAEPQCTIYGGADVGPVFGSGCDLRIGCPISTSVLGATYRGRHPEDRTSLAGEAEFALAEYEVYRVIY